MKNSFKIVICLASASLILSACGKQVQVEKEKAEPITVSVRSAKDSHTTVTSIDYPGTVVSESEAKIVAKATGNATNVRFKVGDKVSAGQELARIDDFSDSPTAGFNSAQVKSAVVAVNQAQSNYEMAKKNYDNLVLSSAKDLRSAEIAKDQSLTGQSNLNKTVAESLKSLELSYETARTASESARLNLENKRKQLGQATDDIGINSEAGVDAIVDNAGVIITSINAVTGFDENSSVTVPYLNNLGAMDSQSLLMARDKYRRAKVSIAEYNKAKPKTLSAKIEAGIGIAEAVRELAESHKLLLDNTISSNNLSSAQLSGLQAGASGYLSQSNALLAQANGLKQALVNSNLNNDSLLDSLAKAYELAKKQEAQANQALASLKAGNMSQQDQAGFAAQSAGNNFDNIKIKVNSALVAAKAQLDMAELSYQNAQINLQSLYDNRQVISPIAGFVTKKLIADGETVNSGQILATVSQTDNVKIQFYLDQENLNYLTAGQTVQIKAGDKSINGIISAISPQADALTKRYLVEVKPENAKAGDLSLGSIVTVTVTIKHGVTAGETIILPLEAVTIGQNENYIYTVDNGKAKKVQVELGAVIGEFAEVRVRLDPQAKIVIAGSRLLSEGQDVFVK